MDVTLQAIRREYATPRSLWVEVIGRGATILAVIEAVRQGLTAGLPLAAAGVGMIVLVGGLAFSRFVAVAVRRSSFDADLWRKFGLDAELLQACNRLPELDEAQAELLDQTLGRLRSLAAVRNHDAWDRDDTPDPGGVVLLSEQALQHDLTDWPQHAERLPATAEAISAAMDGQRRALAAILHDQPDDLALAWAEFEAARDKLAAATPSPSGSLHSVD